VKLIGPADVSRFCPSGILSVAACWPASSDRATTGNLTSSHQKVDDKHDQQHTADPATDYWAAIIIPAASTEQKKQDDDNQNNVHVSSGLSLPLLRWVPSATFNFRKLGDGNPEALNGFHYGR